MSQKDVVRLLYEHFSPWGQIEDIYFNSQRWHAFIKYTHRFYAEFAREAMTDQVLIQGQKVPLRLQWALDSPLDKQSEQELREYEAEVAERGGKPQIHSRKNYLSTP